MAEFFSNRADIRGWLEADYNRNELGAVEYNPPTKFLNRPNPLLRTGGLFSPSLVEVLDATSWSVLILLNRLPTPALDPLVVIVVEEGELFDCLAFPVATFFRVKGASWVEVVTDARDVVELVRDPKEEDVGNTGKDPVVGVETME